MKQTFDLVSHFFALLPLAVLSSSISLSKCDYETKLSAVLFIFLIIAVVCSVAYHSFDDTCDCFAALHAIDRFTSSTIVILTFWLYIDRIKMYTGIAIFSIFILVILEAYEVISGLTIEIYVGMLIVIAISIFVLKWSERYDYLKQEDDRKRMYDLKDPFFGSFFLTQILAVVFFMIDVDPYYHSLWHLFAFVSLGSVLIHSLPGQDLKYGKYSRGFYVALIYWLGSLPSRFFISAIFIHMEKGDGWPIAIVFVIFTLTMLGGALMICLEKYNYMRKNSVVVKLPNLETRRKWTMLKGAITYSIITVLLFLDMIAAAGYLLGADTILSAIIWLIYKNSSKDMYSRVPPVPQDKSSLKLNNMVF